MNVTKRNLKEVIVFLASPGDTVDARNRARKAIKHINRCVANYKGILFVAKGWEDISTGKADRAQDLINPYLKNADIFIGIFNKRFGTPTGKAESGTKEEYDIICRRWEEEDPPPEVKVYFKRLSKADSASPSSHLKKVLDFQADIKPTVKYHVFPSVEKLGKRIEEELADLVHNKQWLQIVQSKPAILSVSDLEIPILSKLIETSSVQHQELLEEFGSEASSAVQDLYTRDLLRKDHVILHPSNSTEGFLAIAKLMFNSGLQLKLLQSYYYQELLKGVLANIVQSRFHFQLSKNQVDFFRKLATLSPSVADYILFGDTELYDNLAEDGRNQNEESFAQYMLYTCFLHRVLLKYGDDSVNSKLLYTVEGVTIEAQVFSISLKTADSKGILFHAESVIPSGRTKATEKVFKGKILRGDAAQFLHTGTLMMFLGELENAIYNLDKVLKFKNAPPILRYGALNNKGVLLMDHGKLTEAEALFEEALKLVPDGKEALKNLERVRRKINSANSSNA